ncbi:S1C family serine protease [Piscinibacter koreensis]|uniref:Trypsin-like peptidase domain-containing protein n=1 Tax=Piscinibacter koreensis TaxID=2742824 RepID=A0A7Y6NPZ9_9BURK|nr:trypsin-like peptidase domain-containing protein [Schlegelella koreensis]NUZ07208.1 trypsin-like peptidase domain-containing protein [Schlegelella koreensis]
MKKQPLYSRSRRAPDSGASAAQPAGDPPQAAPNAEAAAPVALGASSPPPARSPGRVRAFALRNERRLWLVAVLALISAAWLFNPRLVAEPALTIEQIDKAVRSSIEEKPLRSPETRAYETIAPSVVRVIGFMSENDDGKDDMPRAKHDRGVGTGVVIIDNGTILTNLHVVSGARRVNVTFANGAQSDAVVISTQPENDLAVLRALTIPDDLAAATMRSTGDLSPGDHVIAVGFPFGIGPSTSSGVVSGLKRQFRSPDGQQMMSNLIQFDAAANPGNSGGPLVTMDGEVVGIVTAILNPSQQRVFVGIGFAVPIENAASAAGLPPF